MEHESEGKSNGNILSFTSSNFRAKYDNINVLAFQRFIMDKMNKIPHISTATNKRRPHIIPNSIWPVAVNSDVMTIITYIS